MMLIEDEVLVVVATGMRTARRELAKAWVLSWGERKALPPEGGEDATTPLRDTARRMGMLLGIGYRLRFESRDELCEWLRTPYGFLALHAPLKTMSSSTHHLGRLRRWVVPGLGS